MFDEFRQKVKEKLNDTKMTYCQLGNIIGVSENSIKCFMCGANSSRRIAEKIADGLQLRLIYHNNKWDVIEDAKLTTNYTE